MSAISRFASSVSGPLVELWRDGPGWLLLFVSLGWFLTLGVRIVYPALLPQVTTEFGVGHAATGAFVGVLWATYALLQFPGGVMADYAGERAVLALSVLITVLAILAVGAAGNLGLFVLATVLLGLGTGLYGTTRLTVISSVYTEMDTTAISVSQAAGNVGNVVLPATAGFVSVYLGWRWGFGYLLPLLLVTAVGIWTFVPRRASPAADGDESLLETMRKVAAAITNYRVLVVTSVLFLIMFTYQSVTGFLPTYLVETKGLDPSAAAVLYSLFFAVAIGVQFVSGLVSDRFSRRAAIALFLGLSVPAFVLLTVTEGFYALIGVVALLSCMLGGFPPANAYGVRALPSEIRGSGFGLLRTLYIMLGALGPLTIGFLADLGWFDEAFLFLGAIALAVSVVSLLLLPTVDRAGTA